MTLTSRVHSVAVPGGRLHAVVDGDGPPFIFVHAGTVDLVRPLEPWA